MTTRAIVSDRPGTAHKVLGLTGWLLLCFGAAAVGSRFMPGEWYAQLNKPAWHPPNWIFAPVWTTLYTMMAGAAWLVWNRGGFKLQRRPLGLFLLQLLLNACWSPLFFGLNDAGLAFAEIVLLWLALLATVITFRQVHPIAAVLLIPYLGWVTFAAVLNFTLWRLNH